MVRRISRRRIAGAVSAVVSSLFPRLLIVAMLVVPLCPRKSWDYSSTQAISEGVTVVRQTHVIRFGIPLQCADLRWYEWSATREGQFIEITDEHVREFADLEYFVVLRVGNLCGLARQTLAWRSARREEILLQTDPRAANLVVRWGMLGTNAAVCFLLAGACFYWKHRRRMVIFERRRKSGRCGACGYNLTGNVSGRCPECGEPL